MAVGAKEIGVWGATGGERHAKTGVTQVSFARFQSNIFSRTKGLGFGAEPRPSPEHWAH